MRKLSGENLIRAVPTTCAAADWGAPRSELRWVLFSAAGLVLVLSVGCSSKEEKEPTPVVSVQAETVKTQNIESTITTSAVLFPRDQVAIVPKIVAPIKKYFVTRGSHVHTGEVLVTLEDKDLKGALTESQGNYQQAESAYNSAAQSAEHDLKIAQEQFDAAQSLYDSRVTLYKQGAMSQKDVQDAKIALSQAHNQYDLAQKQYTLKSAQGQLTAAQGKLATAEADVGYSTIISPIDGVVTDRPYYGGETPAAGAPIVTVMDLARVVARAYLTPQQAAQLHIGDSASIVPENGQPEIPGKVTIVSPAVDPNSTTIQVWVEAANPRGQLKPGTTVGVKIVSSTVKDALVVPQDAILTGADGAKSVMLIGADQVAHLTAVTTGVRQDDDVQILSGLKAGQQVVTQGAYGLPDGAKVTIAGPAEPAEKQAEP
jgi:HlyD family secretion protein